jgi:type II secretory pathway pseudopilin PulG
MRFNPTHRPASAAKRARAAFTLAEVLAALAFMAIVIPVAVEGLRIANLAGQVGQRKAAAAQIAERVLNEWMLTSQSQMPAQSGTIQEGVQQFRWTVQIESWPEDNMRLVTVRVIYQVQGRDYDVHLSTLLDNSSQ